MQPPARGFGDFHLKKSASSALTVKLPTIKVTKIVTRKGRCEMSRVSGKVALVTGGAVGLGAATAKLLAKEGAQVVVTDINEDDGKQVAKDINDAGGDAIFIRHDVTDEAEWESVYEQTVGKFGRVDVVVNNAGTTHNRLPDEEDLDSWRRVMAVNVESVQMGTKHAILTMKKYPPRTQGSIINLSSIAGIAGIPNLSAYNASKGAVRLYTKGVALYCAENKLGIRANTVHPGYIWTPMVQGYVETTGASQEEGREQIAALHPIGEVGEPDDIAYGVLYLASDESKFVTGSELVIDGGYTAQ